MTFEVMFCSGVPVRRNVCVAGQRMSSEGVSSVLLELLGLAWLCCSVLRFAGLRDAEPPHHCPTRDRQQSFGFRRINGN